MGRITDKFDPNVCRQTCHPVTVHNPRWKQPHTLYFCKGVIGPLKEEQVKQYCW